MARAMVDICGVDYSFLPSRSSIEVANKADKIEMESVRMEQIQSVAETNEKLQLNFDGKHDSTENFSASGILTKASDDILILQKDAYYRHPDASDIACDLISTIKQFKLQQNILFTCSDTTNMNSGNKKGVMLLLQKPENYQEEMSDQESSNILVNYSIMCRLHHG